MSDPLKITLHPVVSSNIDAAGYDPVTKTLEIRFKTGASYRYSDVPKEQYDAMWKSESVGKFVASNIASKFKYAKVVPIKSKK